MAVRNLAKDWRLGGAPSNTEVFHNDIHQYRHARSTNARVQACEPHDLLRHTLQKLVEPGEYWLPFGGPRDIGVTPPSRPPSRGETGSDWTLDETLGRRLTERAREVLRALEKGVEPAEADFQGELIPAPVDAVAVSLYQHRLSGMFITELSYRSLTPATARPAP